MSDKRSKYTLGARPSRSEPELPDVRKPDDWKPTAGWTEDPFVVGISVADIHITDIPPVARGDKDWWIAQERPWIEICALRDKYNVPILCAGDIFHKYNPSPETINFALRVIPKMIGVPGQHDLPYHDLAQIKKSAYWTLCEAGVIRNLTPGKLEPVSDWFAVMGFPWGVPLKPWIMGQPLQGFNIALVHKHIWTKKTGFPGADPNGHVAKVREALGGYRIVISGDNHKPFSSLREGQQTSIFNVGGLMRRRTDEKDHAPSVGLIWNDGNVTREYLDTSEDVLLEKAEIVQRLEEKGGFEEMFQAARELYGCSADFIEAVWEAVNRRKCDQQVSNALTQFLERK